MNRHLVVYNTDDYVRENAEVVGEGDEVDVFMCDNADELTEALSAPADMLIVWAHGWTKHHGIGSSENFENFVKFEDLGLTGPIQARVVVALMCYQSLEHWRGVTSSGTIVTGTPGWVWQRAARGYLSRLHLMPEAPSLAELDSYRETAVRRWPSLRRPERWTETM